MQMEKQIELSVGTVLEERYRIGEVCRRTGAEICYLAHDELLDEPILVFEFAPSDIAGRDGSAVIWKNEEVKTVLLKEMRLLAKTLPGLCGIRSVFPRNNTLYLVAEPVTGTPLSKFVADTTLTLEQAMELLSPVMDAVAQLHEKSMVHANLNPDFIVVNADGKAALTDLNILENLNVRIHKALGLACASAPADGFGAMEQYLGSGTSAPCTDVYACGALLYFCCTGIVPQNASERMLADSLACVPPMTAKQFDLIQKAMAIMPKDRFASVAELRSGKVGRTAAKVPGAPAAGSRIDVSGKVSAFLDWFQSLGNVRWGIVGGAALLVLLLVFIPKGNQNADHAPDLQPTVSTADNDAEEAPEAEDEDGVFGDYSYVLNESGITITAYVGNIKNMSVKLDLPDTLNGMTVTAIGEGAFSDYDSFNSVIIPETVKEIGEKAFYHCNALTSVTIPNGVEIIDSMAFAFCPRLDNVFIPRSVHTLGTCVFTGSNALRNLTISKDNNYYWATSKDDKSFCPVEGVIFNRTRSTIVEFPTAANITSFTTPYGVTTVGEKAFYGCEELKNITLSKDIIAVEESAFEGCIKLNRAGIPESVMQIEKNAFKDCVALDYVRVTTDCSLNPYAFPDTCKVERYNISGKN